MHAGMNMYIECNVVDGHIRTTMFWMGSSMVTMPSGLPTTRASPDEME